jgi:Domain of unknown function (DUF4338)
MPKHEAQRKLAEYIEKYTSTITKQGSSIASFNDLWKAFCAVKAGRWSKKMREDLGYLFGKHVIPILPWVRVPHLASHILGRMAKLVPGDWQQLYAHPIYWLETFIDPARFAGTCYRAANWIRLGRTTGRGHNARTKKATQPVKNCLLCH